MDDFKDQEEAVRRLSFMCAVAHTMDLDLLQRILEAVASPQALTMGTLYWKAGLMPSPIIEAAIQLRNSTQFEPAIVAWADANMKKVLNNAQ